MTKINYLLGKSALVIMLMFSVYSFWNLERSVTPTIRAFTTDLRENFNMHKISAGYTSNEKGVENENPMLTVLGSINNIGADNSNLPLDYLRPERIIIKSIGIDLQVNSVSLENGTWPVYDGVANYAEGTSLINYESGNVGIYGHAQAGVFRGIKDLKLGSLILIVASNGYNAIYIVDTVHEGVEPDQVEVFYPSDEPILTLVTCDGNLSEQRFVVRAKLKSIHKNDQ